MPYELIKWEMVIIGHTYNEILNLQTRIFAKLKIASFMKTPNWQSTSGLVQSSPTIKMRHGINLHSSKQVDL